MHIPLAVDAAGTLLALAAVAWRRWDGSTSHTHMGSAQLAQKNQRTKEQTNKQTNKQFSEHNHEGKFTKDQLNAGFDREKKEGEVVKVAYPCKRPEQQQQYNDPAPSLIHSKHLSTKLLFFLWRRNEVHSSS
jgi:hypothetical protein